ncbi:MAG: RDD family protein [Rubrobacteraceae bacterium]|nr:RDD family protein [Rubrobacter sp.]
MAEVTGPPVATMEVHVTGRRVLSTIVDGIILGVVFAVLSMLFGETSASGGSVNASLGTLGTLLLTVVGFAYFILMEGYMGQTAGEDGRGDQSGPGGYGRGSGPREGGYSNRSPHR